jgi:hypothetical protein
MDLAELLSRGRSGDAILFCGAGFTASSLGYDFDGTLGVGAHLLDLLNCEITRKGENGSFRQLPNAASKYKQLAGEHGLMTLLKSRFTLSNVTQDMSDVIKYPWARIYTTNFDNGIELASDRVPKRLVPFNNTDEPTEAITTPSVIHLHGFAERWDIHNFNTSCILDTASYAQLPSVGKWLEYLRIDLERASAVVFVGFSANDFHLNQIFFNASGLREKAVFVNRPTSMIDPDAEMQQIQYGRPLYIGVDGLAAAIRTAVALPEAAPLSLASFRKFDPVRPSSKLPSVQSIQDLLTLGVPDREQAARDVSIRSSSYHVCRDTLTWVENHFENGARVFLLSGEVCDGKSLVAEDLAQKFSEHRPVFWLGVAYDDLLDEVARILDRYPDAVLVVENCFELRTERLSLLARAFDGGNGLLLLTARTIAADAETGKVKSLKPLSSFREHRLSSLSDEEISALEQLVDQFGGFAHLGSMTRLDRERYIRDRCGRSLPAVLLDILKSQHVRDRYREQINRIDPKGTGASNLLVASLFLKHIGDPPPVSFLSDVFSTDVGDVIARANVGNGSFHLLRIERGFVQTVPAIGASLILREFFEDADIVTAVVTMLERMAQRQLRSTEYERYAFGQLMRYSRLITVVKEEAQIERFFDHISKIGYFREEPLFWLQWHMAKAATGSFVDAERLLDRGYAEAGNWEKRRRAPYNRKQLDDRKAKFLILRADRTERAATDLFRDMKSACEIVERLLRDAEITHHPFETLEQILQLLSHKNSVLPPELRAIILPQCRNLIERGERRLSDVADGYQKLTATRALEISTSRLSSVAA